MTVRIEINPHIGHEDHLGDYIVNMLDLFCAQGWVMLRKNCISNVIIGQTMIFSLRPHVDQHSKVGLKA